MQGHHGTEENVHDRKASPLHPHLRNPQQPCETLEPVDLLAACNIRATRRQGEDVGKGASAGGGAEEDEVGGDTGRGAPRDDAVVLREVGD